MLMKNNSVFFLNKKTDLVTYSWKYFSIALPYEYMLILGSFDPLINEIFIQKQDIILMLVVFCLKLFDFEHVCVIKAKTENVYKRVNTSFWSTGQQFVWNDFSIRWLSHPWCREIGVALTCLMS